jgi:hypothetical protein
MCFIWRSRIADGPNGKKLDVKGRVVVNEMPVEPGKLADISPGRFSVAPMMDWSGRKNTQYVSTVKTRPVGRVVPNVVPEGLSEK